MKKILSILFTLHLTISMNAQLGVQKNRLPEAELIKELPLLIVLHEYDDPLYKKMNVLLKEAIEKYWTYSKSYEFITKEKLRELSKDKSKKDKYAYLMYSEKLYQANVPAGVFCIGLLNKKTFTHFKKFGNPDKELTLADYKIGLNWLQRDLALPFGFGEVNKRNKVLIEELKERISQDTLLIDEDLINDDLKKDIAEIYKNEYKIVSKEIIDKAIINETPNILYLKSLETLTRPITTTSSNREEIGIGGNGNNNYFITESKSHNVLGIIMNNIYRADNQDFLIQILADKKGKTRTKDFKRMIKAIK